MSQAGVILPSGIPSIPTSFVTDSGTAVPVANILNVLANDSTANDADGITSVGSGNTVTLRLTNRLQGTGSTTGAVTADIITFSLGATPGVYAVEFRLSAFESTTPAGLGYSIFAAVRTTGAAASLIGTPDFIESEEAALVAADADIIASGNNIIVRVTGVAGLTINWSVVGLYTFVS